MLKSSIPQEIRISVSCKRIIHMIYPQINSKGKIDYLQKHQSFQVCPVYSCEALSEEKRE